MTSSIMTPRHCKGFRSQGVREKAYRLNEASTKTPRMYCKDAALYAPDPRKVKQQLRRFDWRGPSVTCGIDFRVMLRKEGLCVEVASNNDEVLNLEDII